MNKEVLKIGNKYKLLPSIADWTYLGAQDKNSTNYQFATLLDFKKGRKIMGATVNVRDLEIEDETIIKKKIIINILLFKKFNFFPCEVLSTSFKTFAISKGA